MKKFLDHDEVARLYIGERLSLRMIAELLGCNLEWVRHILVARGIGRRPAHVTSPVYRRSRRMTTTNLKGQPI